jgi:hypothetical protein
MENQPELFGEFKEAESKKSLLGEVGSSEKRFIFAVAQDRLILLAIALIIVLVIMFAIGFERGRRSVLPRNAVRRAKVVSVNPELPKSFLSKPYMIQVATYKSKELAKKEGTKIKSAGFPVVIVGINGLYQILVGDYATEKEAQEVLNSLKKIYSGSFIRKR